MITLKEVHIENLILMEKAVIPFEAGLNVLTGETGAGKSAVIEALSLLAGAKADSTKVRHGAEKAMVTAFFDGTVPLLKEVGIDEEESLVIRREITKEGKSRAWVNDQPVQVGLLKKLGEHLVRFVGQHAVHELFSIEHHRDNLDIFLKEPQWKEAFQKEWIKEKEMKEALQRLQIEESVRLEEVKKLQDELADIEKVSPQEGEDELLFQEYQRLNSVDELAEILHRLLNVLQEEELLPCLNREKQNLEKAAALDISLREAADLYQESLTNLSEVSYQVGRSLSRLEHDPKRLEEVNERLQALHRLKKRYGPELIDVFKEKKSRFHQLQNHEEAIESLQKALDEQKQKTNQAAKALSQKRKEGAIQFSQAMTAKLRLLNMPKVEFHIKIKAAERSLSGDDQVEFWMRPNAGEREIALQEAASGGELSRVMLSLETVLASQGETKTLIFDEIDANIGGETAVAVALQLKELGSKGQVILITHFVQVAKQANHHLCITKQEKKGRTTSTVTLLQGKERELEYERMSGQTVDILAAIE